MKKLILALLNLIVAMGVMNAQDYNPFVQAATVSPAPLLPWEFDGSGELYFEVGNAGVDDLPLVTDQEMTLVITLSNGVPNDADPIAALGGTALSWFDWSYDSGTKSYTAVQNQLISGLSQGTITIQYAVNKNTPVTNPSNGFNVNLQPPPYSNGSNTTVDDAVSIYTYVEAYDYGDAPLSYGQAVHFINVYRNMQGNYTQYLYLGTSVDPEYGYLASSDATGDDSDGTDDENGVTFPTLFQGTTVTVPIVLSSQNNSFGFLNAWIDWNADGDFNDTGEKVLSSFPVPTSMTYNFELTIPTDAQAGLTFARFRLGANTTSPSSSNAYGEVEDYQIMIEEALPALSVIKSQTSAGTMVGDFIYYDIVVENTGNVSVTNINITDDNASILSGNPIGVLNPGQSTLVTARHQITQEDMDAGYVANTAIALGDSPGNTGDVSDTSDTGTDETGSPINDPELTETPNSLDPNDINGDPTDDPTVTELVQIPVITLLKEGTLADGGDGVDAGDVINYNFTVTNNGNVTLYDVVLTDTDLDGGVANYTGGLTDEDGDTFQDDLAVGASASYTGVYTLTQDDVDAGSYTNTAEVTGEDPAGSPVTDDDSDLQEFPGAPSLSVIKNETGRSNVIGEYITYDIIVTNTGNVTVQDIDVTDLAATILTGNPIISLTPGASATVTAQHEITQADVDAGYVENTATATGDSPQGGPDDVSDISDTGTDTDGNTIIDPETVATPNGDGSPGTPAADDDPTVTPILVPDVTPVITAVPNVMHGVTNFNIFIEITELNLVNTNGLITVKVPVDERWTLDGPYDPGLALLGGIPLNNSEWTYSLENDGGGNPAYHVFSSNTVIPGGDFSMIGFKAIWDAGQTQGIYTITSQIVEGSGNENRIDNNVDAEKLDYFIE